MRRKRIFITCALLGTMVLLLSACGNSNSNSDDNSNVTITINGNTGSGNEVEGSGEMTTKEIELSQDQEYTLEIGSISRSNSTFEVIVDPSGNGIEVTADDNVIDEIQVEADGDAITISADEDISFQNIECTITIHASVVSITADGAASVTYETPENAEQIEITLDGASTITASGSVQAVNYDIEGASTVEAFDLVASSVTATVSGASTVNLCATDTLEVVASGVSTVTYDGEPQSVSDDVSGMSTIKAKE